ncbi:MAG: histidinol-phosphate transaminase [Pseudomonadota bacterium]
MTAQRLGPRPLANILEITPYKGGEKPETGHKLSSNENPLGAAPAVHAALEKAAENLALYPDGGCGKLRASIASTHGLDADRIVCGAGSDELFQLLGRAYLAPGDQIVQSAHGFLVYSLVAQQSGAEIALAPERDYTADVDAMLERVGPKTRIVFLANPNNPTGTYIPHSEVKRLHAGLPEDVLLVLDGAYAEYVRRNDYSSGLELAAEMPNVLMTRTFSKIHGLAALRLGWAYGPASVIDAINRVRGPFNVSSLAQAAGIAALEDRDFVDRSVHHNEAELERVSAALAGLGLETVPSVGNFVLVNFGDAERAAAADAYLRARNIYLRGMAAYRLPTCLRLSIGTTEANDAVMDAFTAFQAG